VKEKSSRFLFIEISKDIIRLVGDLQPRKERLAPSMGILPSFKEDWASEGMH
jgi:hypothetical protein